MRSRSLVSLVSVLALSTTLACSDDNGTIPFDQLGSRLAAASCKNTFKCCDAAERVQRFQIFDPAPTTEAECTTTLTAFYQAFLGDNEAVTAGRIGYDAGAAADCVAAIDSAACGVETDQADAACDGVFVGQVALGQPCKDDDECAGAGFCDGGTSTTFGACVALPTIGMACTDSCVDGAYCDAISTRCAATKANGATCDFSNECVSENCDPDGLCAAEPASTVCDGV